MAMNKKECELLEHYRQVAMKHEKNSRKLNELKTYLKLSIKIDNNKEYEKILTFLDKTFDI